MKRYANKIQLVLHPMPHFSRTDDALFSDQQMEYDVMGAILTSQMGSGTPLHKTLRPSLQKKDTQFSGVEPHCQRVCVEN